DNPGVTDERERVHEANAGGRHTGFDRDAFHLHADEIVAKANSPQLLADTSWCSTPNSFFAREHVRFDLVVAQLDFPTLVIQIHEFAARVLFRIRQRREQDRLRKSLTLI